MSLAGANESSLVSDCSQRGNLMIHVPVVPLCSLESSQAIRYKTVSSRLVQEISHRSTPKHEILRPRAYESNMSTALHSQDSALTDLIHWRSLIIDSGSAHKTFQQSSQHQSPYQANTGSSKQLSEVSRSERKKGPTSMSGSP